MRARHGPCPRPRAARTALALAALLSTSACGLSEGERFGRAGVQAGRVRVRVEAPLGDVDPARAAGAVERAVARQLFATLLEDDGSMRLAASVEPSVDGRRVTVRLRPGARFADGSPLDADAVVWSWRRALWRSTGAVDLAPFRALANGQALAEGRLLQVARATAGRAAPYTRHGVAPEAAAPVSLLPGTTLRVLDSNERRPCCGGSVALRREPEAGEALGVLRVSDIGTVIGERVVGDRSFLLVRSPSGASGWAAAALLATHVPPASLAHVIDRGDGSAALRVGPDDDAPVREPLGDDAMVEVLGEAEGWLQAVDPASGQMGFMPERALDTLRGERQWLLVEVVSDGESRGLRGWVPLKDLAFDPSALGVRALDELTLEIDRAAPLPELLAALSRPVLAPVPSRAIAAHGRAWTAPDTLASSGAYRLEALDAERAVLVPNASSFEAARAHLTRVELVTVADPISALHLYRAGELDVLPSAPEGLAPLLRRAADWVETDAGGGLRAPELRGLSLARLDWRDVEVATP